jgi:hypothetical protein
MRIRVLWLVDAENKEVGTDLSGDVLSIIPALSKLGIGHPRLVANCMVNASREIFKSLGKVTYNGEDAFVRLNGSCRLVGNKPLLNIDLGISLQNIPKDPAAANNLSHLETEIQAPFGHYVILGMTPTGGTTSVFVVQVTAAE